MRVSTLTIILGLILAQFYMFAPDHIVMPGGCAYACITTSMNTRITYNKTCYTYFNRSNAFFIYLCSAIYGNYRLYWYIYVCTLYTPYMYMYIQCTYVTCIYIVTTCMQYAPTPLT